MSFHKGDKVWHADLPDEHDVGTINNVRQGDSGAEYHVVWGSGRAGPGWYAEGELRLAPFDPPPPSHEAFPPGTV